MNRCCFDKCNKKLSLVDKSCKCICKNNYCILHRLPESHKCSIQYERFKIKYEACYNKKIIKI
uniref:AN1-type domain-containing protein n=1 Tax=viral metagenome TaxID=1070528 RepID=A0A6C0KFV6_9ZZZZ